MAEKTTTPVRTPTRDPEEAPGRRLHPDTICPNQKERVVRRIVKDI